MATKTIFNPLLRKRFQQLTVGTSDSDKLVQSVQTTDATQTTLPTSRAVTSNTVQSFVTRVTAIEGATGDVWSYEFRGAVKNLAGTTTLVDTVWSQEIAEDVGATLWSVSIEANDTTDVLDIKVTGEAAHTIEWYASTIFNEVTF